MTTVIDTSSQIAAPAPQPPPAPGRRSWLGPACALGPTLAVLVVQACNISGWPAASDDEGTYLAQAWAVQHVHALAPYTYWYDHPPLGWLQIALMSWLPGLFASPDHLLTASLRVVMLPVTAVSCLLLYLLARRFGLPRWGGSLAVLLFGLSPLSVSLQRQVLLDNFAVLWILAAFVLCASPRRDLWHHTAAGIAAGFAVLSKETIAVVLPAVALLLWQRSHRSTRKFTLVGASCGFILVASLYPLYALLKGELLPGQGHVSLLGGVIFQMTRQGSGSLLSPHSPSRQIFDSWLYYDHVLVLGGLVAVLLQLTRRQLWAVSAAVVLLAATAVRPGYLPAMFVIQALPFLALALAGAADRFVALTVRALPSPRLRPVRMAVVGLAALLTFGFTVPRWYAGDSTATTADVNSTYDQAATWLRGHVRDPASTRVVVDDALWLDLVRDGSRPGAGAIWFYKLDLDTAVARTLPHGWRDLDYIVSTPAIRQPSNSQLATVSAALAHSTVVASFGNGDAVIQIRRIVTPTEKKAP